MKKLLLLIMGLAVLALAARFLSTVPAIQDRLVPVARPPWPNRPLRPCPSLMA